MEHCSVIKRNELLGIKMKWMNLNFTLFLSENSLSEKDTYCMIAII